jgi:transcriptional regulator with GAF, ATPase, and Fis domain
MMQKQLIGESPSIIKLKEEIKKYSGSDVSILIKGASGTGKELVAYNIHYNSSRKFENFVAINCGSLPNELVESELFGYEKGAFTGADKRKPGLFELAHQGTIFLDEITELPPSAQVKLLRVIQNGELEKIGRTEKVKVNVRLIASTNRDIEEEVKARRFREDLYYRLNVVPIFVPELKNRKEDIPVLLDHFSTIMCLNMGKEKPSINKEALDILINYEWAGNVREFENIVQRLLFNDEPVINALQVKKALGIADKDEGSVNRDNEIEFMENGKMLPLKQLEKTFRQRYFKFVRDNSDSDTDAAKKMGLAPPNYHRMAKELGLK